jgi:hypothetical protein
MPSDGLKKDKSTVSELADQHKVYREVMPAANRLTKFNICGASQS